MNYTRQVFHHLQKDLRLEWRSRDSINGMLFFALLVVIVFSLAGVIGLSGCTNPVPVAPGGITPAGTAPLTVTFTDNNTPQVSHAISFTLTIVPSS